VGLLWEAHSFLAQISAVTATVNKLVIRDAGGNVMEDDYEFKFTVNDTQNNLDCPPSC